MGTETFQQAFHCMSRSYGTSPQDLCDKQDSFQNDFR
jgi:hypothetical protein